jgi:hypothetical protein
MRSRRQIVLAISWLLARRRRTTRSSGPENELFRADEVASSEQHANGVMN